MRKSIWTILVTSLVAIVAVGCAKQDDYNALSGRVDGIEGRVNVLEQAVKELNTQTIPSLQAIVKALQEGVTVTSVAKNEEAGTVTITFSNGQTATIKNGEKGEKGDKGDKGDKGEDGVDGKDGENGKDGVDGKDGENGKDGVDGKDGENGKDGVDGKDGENGKDGVDGQDGTTPDISIKYIAGTGWVWVINGVEQKDEQGNYIPVVSDPTATPKFKIEDGSWYVSYDGGKTYERVGLVSNTESSIFVEEETEEYIRINVNGSKLDIPKEKPFKLVISYEGDLGSVGVNQNQSLGIAYSIEGVAEGDDVTVDVLSTTAGISAKITKTDFKSGYILITTTDVTSGKVFVYADNNKGKTNIKSITLEEGVLTAVADVQQVPAEGGIIALAVTTNVEYDAVISDGGETWITVEPKTKAAHTDDLVIKVAANTTGAYRFATVSVVNRSTGETVAAYDILQQPAADVVTDLASIAALKDDTSVLANKVIVLAASQEGALVGDGNTAIYVKTDVALAVGDEVAFTGVKKSDENLGVVYVEAASVTVSQQGQAVPDLKWYAFMYHTVLPNTNTSTSGVLSEVEGLYVVNGENGPVVLEKPLASFDLASLVGKIVTITGYTNGYLDQYDAQQNFTGYTKFILNKIEEVVFQLNPSWTLTFDSVSGGYDVFNMSVADGCTDWYASYNWKAYTKEEATAVGGVEVLAQIEILRLSNLIQGFLTYYNETIADDAKNVSSQLGAKSVAEYGDFVAFAVGVDEFGNPTGKYAVCEYTKEDQRVPASYADYLGEWHFVNSEGRDDIWTIKEKENGKTYTIEGITGMTAPNGGVAAEAVYDAATSSVTISNQTLGQWNYSAEMAVEDKLVAVYYNSGKFYSNEKYMTDPLIMTMNLLKDGTIGIAAASDSYGPLEGFAYIFQVVGSTSWGSYSVSAKLPGAQLIKASSEDPYQAWIGTWTVTTGDNSYDMTISEDVANESYIIKGYNGFASKTWLSSYATFDAASGGILLKGGKKDTVKPCATGVQFSGKEQTFSAYLMAYVEYTQTDGENTVNKATYFTGDYTLAAGKILADGSASFSPYSFKTKLGDDTEAVSHPINYARFRFFGETDASESTLMSGEVVTRFPFTAVKKAATDGIPAVSPMMLNQGNVAVASEGQESTGIQIAHEAYLQASAPVRPAAPVRKWAK